MGDNNKNLKKEDEEWVEETLEEYYIPERTIKYKKSHWKEYYNKALGEALLMVLKKRNISQKELSKMIDVAPSTVNQWTRGNNTIPGDYLLMIQDMLDVDLNYYAQHKAGALEYKIEKDIPLQHIFDDMNRLKHQIKSLSVYYSDSMDECDLNLINKLLDNIYSYVKEKSIFKENKNEQDQ